MGSRDEFPAAVKRLVADRVAHSCSNPGCQARTSGPQADPGKALNVGVAAHITAAAPGGPRYDSALGSRERSGAANAIWLCQTCAKLVDNDPARYSADMLRDWKRRAELRVLAEVGKAVAAVAPRSRGITAEEADILIASSQKGEIYLMRCDQYGPWVRVARHDFHEEEDPAVAAEYVVALDSLRRKGLCRHEVKMLYQLTAAGFKVARRLRELMGSDA